jgi:hypothetical protein
MKHLWGYGQAATVVSFVVLVSLKGGQHIM